MTHAPRTAGLPLRLRDVRVAFSDGVRVSRTVLDIAELEIPAGSQATLCGPSGSGKTTLLNVLAAIERPAQGSVRWGEVEATDLVPAVADRWRRETIGFVFQQIHLFPGLSALQNVLLPYRFDRWSVGAELHMRATSLLERVGVRAGADAACLSRGEAQRVAVARALIRDPAIVLADEPTASLDRGAGAVVAELLRDLCAASGATLLVATHDASLAASLGASFELSGGDVRPKSWGPPRPRLVCQV